MPATRNASDDRRAGAIRDGGRGAHEQAGADDGADAQRDERPRAERPLQRALARRRAVGHQAIDRLRSKQ